MFWEKIHPVSRPQNSQSASSTFLTVALGDLTDLFIWGGAEMWIVLIALNLPPNLPFFKRLIPLLASAIRSFFRRTWEPFTPSVSDRIPSKKKHLRVSCGTAIILHRPTDVLTREDNDGVQLNKFNCQNPSKGDGWVTLNNLERADERY